MIKSKIDARERALELAIAHYNGIEGNRVIDAVETAKKFESYLIGDAELPETEPSTKYESPLMSSEEVMKTLNVSNVTLYRWEKQGILIPRRIGGTRHFLRADVQSLINNPTAESKDK